MIVKHELHARRLTRHNRRDNQSRSSQGQINHPSKSCSATSGIECRSMTTPQAVARNSLLTEERKSVPLRISLQRTEAAAPTILIRLLVGLVVFLPEGIQKLAFPEVLGAGRFARIGIPLPDA